MIRRATPPGSGRASRRGHADRRGTSAGGRLARDRHGRGLRGPLLPSHVPAARSRGEAFDDLVLDAVEHLEERWQRELEPVEFAVEDVPPAGAPDGEVPLASLTQAHGDAPPRIVLYRRPLEARARNPLDLADLVHDVVVDQVAELLGLDPDTVDGLDE